MKNYCKPFLGVHVIISANGFQRFHSISCYLGNKAEEMAILCNIFSADKETDPSRTDFTEIIEIDLDIYTGVY